MHEWAVAVERIGGRIDEDLKSSQGPPAILEWLEAVSNALATEDEGGVVDTALARRIDTLRRRAQPFLAGGLR
ncbi:MAG: hypothetical protein Kow0010_24670 [Dehalococcoidia bacterium]